MQPLGGGEEWKSKTDFQLYDMANDPREQHNVAAENPERVAILKAAYDAWFNDVTNERDFSVPQRIFVGAAQENPVLLTRQDWRGPKANWGPGGIGYWELNIVTPARYNIKLRFNPAKTAGEAQLTCAGVSAKQLIKAGSVECVFKNIQLPAGPGRLEAMLLAGPDLLGVKFAEVTRNN